MLTAFQDEEYKMSAFASLADGYLKTPSPSPSLKSEGGRDFQASMIQDRVFSYKDTKVDFESYSASLAGEKWPLMPRVGILDYLVKK